MKVPCGASSGAPLCALAITLSPARRLPNDQRTVLGPNGGQHQHVVLTQERAHLLGRDKTQPSDALVARGLRLQLIRELRMSGNAGEWPAIIRRASARSARKARSSRSGPLVGMMLLA